MLCFHKFTSYLGSGMYYTTIGLEIFVRRNSPILPPPLIHCHEYSLNYIDDIIYTVLAKRENVSAIYIQRQLGWQKVSPAKVLAILYYYTLAWKSCYNTISVLITANPNLSTTWWLTAIISF